MTKLIADYFKTQPVVKAWLFGSFARGEETPLSDVGLQFAWGNGVALVGESTCESFFSRGQ